MTVANPLLAALILLAIAITIGVAIRLKDKLVLQKIARSLRTQPSIAEVFEPNSIADLPLPVQRYFLHAIAPGTPLAKSVELEMQGGLKLQPQAAWIPMQGREILSAMKGFIWQASIGYPWLRFLGADYYIPKSGRVRFSLWGIIPIARGEGIDISRSSLGRFVSELIWLPSALLPQQGVQWQAIDDRTIQAHLEIEGEPISIAYQLADDGKLEALSLLRWGDKTEDGTYGYIPFGGNCQRERTFSGFTIPSQIKVGWWFGTDKYSEFFQAEIQQAQYS